MITILLNLSKYIILFAMLYYTYLCFSINGTKNPERLKRKYLLQNIFCMLIFTICYLIILYYNPSFYTIFFFSLEWIFLIVYLLFYRGLYPDTSRLITNNTCMLLALGFVMVERLAPDNALKQFILVLAGAAVSIPLPKLIQHGGWMQRFRYPFAAAGILLLLGTLILGKTSYGANLSISIFGMSFQPSEFVKLIYVIFVAAMLSKSTDRKSVIISAVLAAAHVIILVASTDLGMALIFFVVYVVMLYVGTGKLYYFFSGLICAGLAATLAYKLFAHVRTRVEAWIDPWSVIDNKGYQITQSLFAIGTGGLFGVGLYQGLPTKIPVVVKDFVFAAVAEEFGLVFAICVILVCFSCFIEIMKSACECQDMQYKLIAVGFGILYIFQCFLTIGGVTKFIPSTGVTLPFVSYGGSSIISSLLMFAVIQTVFIRNKKQGEHH